MIALVVVLGSLIVLVHEYPKIDVRVMLASLGVLIGNLMVLADPLPEDPETLGFYALAWPLTSLFGLLVALMYGRVFRRRAAERAAGAQTKRDR